MVNRLPHLGISDGLHFPEVEAREVLRYVHRWRAGSYLRELGVNVVLWGIIMMCHAIPTTFGPFFALRILLGQSLSYVSRRS